MSILKYNNDSSNEEQQHSVENKQVDFVQETLNKSLNEMEEEKPSFEESSDTEKEIDLHKPNDLDKKPFIRKKSPIEKKMKSLSFDKEYIKQEKKPKAMTSKKVIPKDKMLFAY